MAEGVPVVLDDARVPIRTTSKPFVSKMVTIPGIPASDAEDANDAMGTQFAIEVPAEGILQTVILADLDKEQIQTDLVFLPRPFSDGVANDAAYDPNDDDMDGMFVVPASTFYAFNDNAIGQATNLAIPYVAPQGRLWIRAVTRGAPNLTATTDYRVQLRILE